VLKTGGAGMKDLSRCRIRQVIDATRLQVDCIGRCWTVEQLFFDGHVASVASQGVRPEWLSRSDPSEVETALKQSSARRNDDYRRESKPQHFRPVKITRAVFSGYPTYSTSQQLSNAPVTRFNTK
jgi:hypothetical protein